MSASTDVIVAAQALAQIQAVANSVAGGEPAQLSAALTQIAGTCATALGQLSASCAR